MSVLLGALLLLGLFWLEVAEYRRAARRTTCKCRLKQIMLALNNYHEKYGSYPPAYLADKTGRPMHSWRVLILPFLERNDLYDQYRFDEPWDGPNNRKLHGEIVSLYRCPSEENARSTDTAYVVVVGERTLFPGSRSITFDDIKDGSSNTFAIVEYHGSGIHWMEPRDLPFDRMAMAINATETPCIRSHHPGGAQIGLADGSVSFFSDSLPSETVKQRLIIDDGLPKELP